MTLRVLSIATLFPNPARPAFGRFVFDQMQALAARGDVELTIVSPVGLPPWPVSLLRRFRDLRQVPDRNDLGSMRVLHPRFRQLPGLADSNPSRLARVLVPLAQALHAEQPFDLVDAQFFFPDGPAAAAVANALGLPLSIKARGSDVHYWGARPRALAQMLKAARQAAGMPAVSDALRRDMIALGMPGEKIAVHYTGLDHARFRPVARNTARAAIGLDARPLLLCPGALIAIKGQALAIAALAQVPAARLALAGAGPDEAALRAIATRLGLADRVLFLGQVPHEVLPNWLSAADAVVLPSEREGLANAWIEALACGTPLVISDTGGAREVVTGPSAGRIVARNADAIAAAIRELLANPPSQADVAAHATRFSWETNAAELAAHYRRICAQ